MLLRIDAWVTRQAERAAHWTQDWFGVTSYRWCQALAGYYAFHAGMHITGYWRPFPLNISQSDLSDVLFGPFVIVWMFIIWYQAGQAQAAWAEGSSAVERIRAVPDEVFFRWLLYFGQVGAVVLLVLWWISGRAQLFPFLWESSGSFSVTALMLLGRVHPRPRQKGRVLVPIFGSAL